MQAFDHASVQGHGAFAGIEGKSLQNTVGLGDFFQRRRKGAVAWGDLKRVDQSLSIKAESAALGAAFRKTYLVFEVVIGAVDHGKSMSPRRRHDLAQCPPQI